MDNKKKLEVLEISAVQSHISMLQGIINRMAANSANCKNWTVTLVAAMLVLLVDKNMQIPNAWICLVPIALFYLLDCYYLGLERLCIASQNKFLKDKCKQFCNTIKAMNSVSTTPFYLIVAIAVLLLGGIIKF